jgi:hypothetical protein
MGTCHATTETLEQAVERLSRAGIAEGYDRLEAVHPYKDLDDKDLFYRIRRKNAGGDKWIRPICLDSSGYYRLGEPSQFKDLPKPLYGLQLLNPYKEATVCVLEGEWATDWLNTFFLKNDASKRYIALTSGGASSATNANWEPLSGRTCILWADNDEPGEKYITQVSEILIGLGCSVKHIDVPALQLPVGGDCVDWIK